MRSAAPPPPMAEAWRLEEDEEELRELGRRHRRVALSSAAGEGRGRGGPRRRLLWASLGPVYRSECLIRGRAVLAVPSRCVPSRPASPEVGAGQRRCIIRATGRREPQAWSPRGLSSPGLSPTAGSFSELG